MKKFLVFGTAVAALLLMSSCMKDDDGNSSSRTALIPAYNLYTPLSGVAAPSVGLARYNFTTAFPAQTITVSTDNMVMPGGTVGSFKCMPLQFDQGQMMVDDINRLTIEFSGSNVSESGSKVTSLNGLITQAAYAPGDQEIPGYKRLIPDNSLQYVIMQYVLDDTWQVRTFWPDMTFRGSTTTTFPGDSGESSTFQNDDIAYRIVMELTKENALTGKADVIFYNAKFAPNMPGITVVLKNLDLKFTTAGYTISGKQAVPYMVEAGELQETPRFKFDNISVECTGDLSSAIITYQVATVFKGRFQGQSLAKLQK